MSVKKQIVIDLMFYLGLPLAIWNLGRGFTGDYLAMFLSALTAILYTAYKFFFEKKYNVTGLVIVFGILLNLYLNLISETAIDILYNGVYLNMAFILLYGVSMVLRRPLGRVFYLDYRKMYGEAREESLEKLKGFSGSRLFDALTLIFIVRELALWGIRALLLQRYGVEGANEVLVYSRIVSYLFIAMIGGMVVYIDKRWQGVQSQNTC
ncbi:MAG: hypothetical protein AVO33_02045 [delta proteobacterium ML8_F1]|nr:MAG: hypothetical protein AVO33_02045 [delta proteobacterium ML8_F1]